VCCLCLLHAVSCPQTETHVPITNRINPLLCLLIHFPYEFKPSCFLGHLNHKIPSGFSKHAIWNFSVFTRTVWPSGRAHTLSLFIFLHLSLILLIISQTLFSFTSSFHSLTHTLHLVTRTFVLHSAFYTYIMHQSKPKRKRDEKLETKPRLSVHWHIQHPFLFTAVTFTQKCSLFSFFINVPSHIVHVFVKNKCLSQM